jgi:acyl-CoA thioesterase II
MSLITTN